MIELNGKVIVESGAIVEILIEKFAPQLMPVKIQIVILIIYNGFIFRKFGYGSIFIKYFNSIELKMALN